MAVEKRQCIISGAGPAGMMLGLLLARAGVQVTVLEQKPDFRREFRGDTIQSSALEVLNSIGIAEEVLQIPHTKVQTLSHKMANKHFVLADFSYLPLKYPYMIRIRQKSFLEYLARKASEYPNFDLRLGTQVKSLIQHDGECFGVRWANTDGSTGEIAAPLVVGTDGRNSTVRHDAGFEVMDFGGMADVIWFRLPRYPDDPVIPQDMLEETIGSFALIPRDDHWRCGLVIKKNTFADIKEQGIDAFRATIAELLPLSHERLSTLESWDQTLLLSIRIDRLVRWWAPGVLCIGDAAHAMSPIGGVGINLAIHDAVATARILAAPLRENRIAVDDLAAVEDRRLFPTRATQTMQWLIRRRKGSTEDKAKFSSTMIYYFLRLPFVKRLMGRLIGVGLRPEYLTPEMKHPHVPT